MGRDRAAYMRDYSARQQASVEVAEPPARKAQSDALAVANRRIGELEAEIRHLKIELARRPSLSSPIRPFGSPRPAPKPSQLRTSGRGQGR
jgi:hypothetical protein